MLKLMYNKIKIKYFLKKTNFFNKGNDFSGTRTNKKE